MTILKLSQVYFSVFDDICVTCGMRKPWSKEEVEFLIKFYPDYGAKYCANRLCISTRRARIKASRLQITHLKSKSQKVCHTCLKMKSFTEFSPHNTGRFGLNPNCKTCRADWESNRKQTDKQYRLLHGIRNRIRLAIKNNSKTSSSKKLLGCSIGFLRKYLQKQFKDGMSWDNYGQWHIDHIKPCSSFDMSLPEAQSKCFHYTNLQPLWAKDNLRKGNR